MSLCVFLQMAENDNQVVTKQHLNCSCNKWISWEERHWRYWKLHPRLLFLHIFD